MVLRAREFVLKPASRSRFAAQPVSRQVMIARPSQRRPLLTCTAVEDDSLTLGDLQTQLELALRVEDYKLAARLRDSIQQKQKYSQNAVEEANRKFYAAFMSGNFQEMDNVWGQGDHVQVVHPGMNCIAGREAVMESWRLILKQVLPRQFQIKLLDLRVFAHDSMGFVTCVEIVNDDDQTGRITATNIFEKQNGRWVIVQHHGSPSLRVK